MKYIIAILLITLSLMAEKITITADHFEANEIKKISILSGHVHIIKGSDDIKANRLVIDFGTNNKPVRYTLNGNVVFDIATKAQHYNGTSQKIIYDPKHKLYTASGNVHIVDNTTHRTLEGEKIIINRISGKSTITGKKSRPVKFTFTVDE